MVYFYFVFVLIAIYLYFYKLNCLIFFIKFIAYHRLVVAYYFLNLLAFFVGLSAILYYHNMSAEDFINDFSEFRVLYDIFKKKILPEIFPEYF